MVFFVLAYALAWGAIPWNSFFAPGVLLAALIVVTLTEGLSGLKALGARLIRWRVSWVWYALAIGVPLLVHLASVAINVGLGAPPPSLGMLSPWYSLPMAIALHALSPTGGPLMEEPSFRGYAQPELQVHHSPIVATTIMAVLVTGWHAPLFFMPVFDAHPIGAVTTVAVTFWYAWLFNHASGSSLLTLDRPRHRRCRAHQQLLVGRCGSGTPQLPVRHRVVHRRPRPAGLRPGVLDPPSVARRGARRSRPPGTVLELDRNPEPDLSGRNRR